MGGVRPSLSITLTWAPEARSSFRISALLPKEARRIGGNASLIRRDLLEILIDLPRLRDTFEQIGPLQC